MNFLARLARIAAGTLALVLAVSFATHPAAAAAAARPFVERVKPDDYHAAEKLFLEPFSRTHELVVLRVTAAEPVSVLALKRATGDTYTLTQHFASASAPDGWLKISEELDAAVAQQVLRAFELKLHRQVTLSNFKRTLSKTDSDLWVYQKLSDDRTAAALISMEATLGNPQASAFVDDFLGGLQKLIGTEGEARSALLQKIDRTATGIILADTPR